MSNEIRNTTAQTLRPKSTYSPDMTDELRHILLGAINPNRVSADGKGRSGPKPRALAERLMSRVDKQPDGCWLWTGSLNRTGYGQISSGSTRQPGFRMLLAHRVSYTLHVGPIPDALPLDHLCRVRRCVNPDHLEPVTIRENLLRGETIPAFNIAKTECPQGHPYDTENTYRRPGGRMRDCKKCKRAAVRRYQSRRKEMSA